MERRGAFYGLYEERAADAKIEFILNQSVKAKMDLLKKLGKIGNKEYKIIDDFSRARNHIIHGHPFEPWATQIQAEAKRQYMALGWKAVQAATEVTISAFRKRLEDLNILSPWEDE